MRKIKDLIKAGALGLALLCQSSDASPAPNESAEINQIIANFPDGMPNALSVKKYPRACSTYLLIHIRDAHNGSYTSGNLRENDPLYAYIKKVQEENYSVLTNVMHILPKASLHKERQVEEWKDSDDPFLSERKSCYMQNISPGEYAAQRYPLDCVARYCLSSGAKIKKTENLQSLIKAQQALNQNSDLGSKLKWVLEEREDAVLSNLTNKVSVLVFGGAHRFGGKESCDSNYEEYPQNKDNLAACKNRIFSLIEITPSSWNNCQ